MIIIIISIFFCKIAINTDPFALEEVQHTVAIVEKYRVQVVRYDVTSVDLRPEVCRDFPRITDGNAIDIVVIFVVGIACIMWNKMSGWTGFT